MTTVAPATGGPAAAPATTVAPTVVAAAPTRSLGSVLVDGAGHTLYRNTKEVGGAIVCTGACATAWLPLLDPTGSQPVGSNLAGSLSTIKRPDGSEQVSYNGAPLYTFAGDRQPGDVNGHGIGGVWFAVTPASTAASATTPAPAPPTTAKPAVATTSPPTTHSPMTNAPTTVPPTTPPTTHPPTTVPPTTPPTTSCLYPPCY